MGISVLPGYSFVGININIVLYIFTLLLNVSVLKFGEGVGLGAHRIEKVKQEPSIRGTFLEGPPERCARRYQPLLCFTMAFGPCRGDQFSLGKKDLYWPQLYLIHNVRAWRRRSSLNPEAAPRNDEKLYEIAYCADMIFSIKFNQAYPKRTPPKWYLQN